MVSNLKLIDGGRNMKRVFWLVMAVVIIVAQTSPLFAESADVMNMLEGMKKQMAGMQKLIEQQNLRIQQLESSKVLETSQPSVPVQATTAMSDTDFQKSLKDNIGEVIPWLKGAKYGGDFRLRSESFDYYDKNNDAGSTGTSADRTRNRFRIRLRWGFEKDYGDDWKFGFRLATGSLTDQASTNQTLSGYFTFKDILVERAYASYSPNGLKDYGILKGVKIAAGKTDNPFLRYSTPIVWDGDVTPEGVYEQATLQFISTEDTKVNFYATAGQFITNEAAANESDAGVYGYQGALNVSTYGFGTEMPVDITGAVSFYDYTNWSQTITSNSSGASFLRTNTIVADDFRVLDLYPEIQFYVGKTPVVLWYNYVNNLANVGTEDFKRSGGNNIHDMDEAWGTGLKVGKLKKKGDWDAHYGYYEIGANAVVAAFNDSDFGGPGTTGHTNRKGHKLGIGYSLTDSITVNWTGFIVQPLNPSTAVASSSNEHVFRSQVDLNFKF